LLHSNLQNAGIIRSIYFFAALTLAHLALVAALIRASPAGEIRRLGAIGTTFWPRVRAQRAFCAAEILARAAVLIVPRPRAAPVLFNPLSALIAVSRALTCWATLSRSAFNSEIMSMCSSPGEDCTGDQAMRSGRLVFSTVDFVSSASDTIQKHYGIGMPRPPTRSPRIAMRSLTWVSDKHLTGWACFACDWTFPLPSQRS